MDKAYGKKAVREKVNPGITSPDRDLCPEADRSDRCNGFPRRHFAPGKPFFRSRISSRKGRNTA